MRDGRLPVPHWSARHDGVRTTVKRQSRARRRACRDAPAAGFRRFLERQDTGTEANTQRMNLLQLILIILAVVVTGGQLLVLRAVRPRVRRWGRRRQVTAGLLVWLICASVLAVVLLVASGSLLPSLVVRSRGVANLTWVELTVATGLLVALVSLARVWTVPALADVGLPRSTGGIAMRDLATGLLIGIVAAAVPLVIGAVCGWLQVRGFREPADLAGGLALGALFFAATAVFEELLFRGALFALVARIAGLPVAWVISLVVFGCIHGFNPGASVLAVVGTAVAGFALTVSLLRTGALWLSIGFHTGWNWALGCLYGFAVSGIGLTSAMEQVTMPDAPDWATGGGFGPEASIPGLLALVLVVAAVWLYTGKRNGMAALFPMGAPE